MSVRRSARAAGAMPTASSRGWRKRSISLWMAGPSAPAGTGTGARGWKAHQFCASSRLMPPIFTPTERGSGAPALIHSTSTAISSAASRGRGWPLWSSSGGIDDSPSTPRIALRRSDASGSPGRIAGPESPPFCHPSRESSARPPLVLAPAWHWRQWATRNGRTLASKWLKSAGSAARISGAGSIAAARLIAAITLALTRR